MITTKTFMLRKEDVQRHWYIIDAKDKVLGRMASKIATLLIGKHKPEYTPHVDTGDYVIVINADKIRLTGNKVKDKRYLVYSGYMGGLKKRPFEWMMNKSSERVIKLAVRRMIPKNKLGDKMITKLKIFKGPDHPHAAQQPQPFDI